MWLVSNPGPLAHEADALPTALRGLQKFYRNDMHKHPHRLNKILMSFFFHEILCSYIFLEKKNCKIKFFHQGDSNVLPVCSKYPLLYII